MTGADTRSAAALAAVEDDVAAAGGRLLVAWPRGTDHLLVEVGTDAGAVAGQWWADRGRARAVGAGTPGSRRHGRLLLQPGGADRRLPGLRQLLTAPGATLVAHRPERRAVLRCGDGSYVKVVRPDRLPAVLAAARAAARLPVRTAPLLSADPPGGLLRTAALPGRPLHDLLGTGAAVGACRELGAALAAVHAAPPPAGLPVHDGAAEAAVLRRWTGLARTWTGAGGGDELAGVLAELTGGPAGPLVAVHRDLHDRQALVAADGSLGLLDFDLLALGEPALDLANLLAHLELRRRQGLLADAGPLRAAVLDGYRPDRRVLDRLAVHEAATRLRLAAVYAFRPGRPVS
ncbi:phosphotransferase [Geodermatophilus sp. DSM 44513]|uniref:phosphotransferase n=1 Tax=Geodermatophilus sp. DSM 44513 TaxID=1528104 RepID=UPI001275C4A5|nr:phosphotransferase [Geodermatophilus sp. DSM 44513]WNV76032.1 phosphotransferase [Geodermatophilus sp. DSM 44513]